MNLYSRYYSTIWSNLPDQELVLGILKNRTAGRMTDLGCATGRILKLALDCKWKVVGIEIDRDMLSALAKELPEREELSIISDDFCQISLQPPNDLITCMANTFTLVIDRDKRQKLLKDCYNNLNPGGCMLLWIISDNALLDKEKEIIFKVPEGTLTYRARTALNYETRIREIFFDFGLNGKFESHVLQTKLISSAEMTQDISMSGFQIVNSYGNFDKTEIVPTAPFQIYELFKAKVS